MENLWYVARVRIKKKRDGISLIREWISEVWGLIEDVPWKWSSVERRKNWNDSKDEGDAYRLITLWKKEWVKWKRLIF